MPFPHANAILFYLPSVVQILVQLTQIVGEEGGIGATGAVDVLSRQTALARLRMPFEQPDEPIIRRQVRLGGRLFHDGRARRGQWARGVPDVLVAAVLLFEQNLDLPAHGGPVQGFLGPVLGNAEIDEILFLP